MKIARYHTAIYGVDGEFVVADVPCVIIGKDKERTFLDGQKIRIAPIQGAHRLSFSGVLECRVERSGRACKITMPDPKEPAYILTGNTTRLTCRDLPDLEFMGDKLLVAADGRQLSDAETLKTTDGELSVHLSAVPC